MFRMTNANLVSTPLIFDNSFDIWDFSRSCFRNTLLKLLCACTMWTWNSCLQSALSFEMSATGASSSSVVMSITVGEGDRSGSMFATGGGDIVRRSAAILTILSPCRSRASWLKSLSHNNLISFCGR